MPPKGNRQKRGFTVDRKRRRFADKPGCDLFEETDRVEPRGIAPRDAARLPGSTGCDGKQRGAGLPAWRARSCSLACGTCSGNWRARPRPSWSRKAKGGWPPSYSNGGSAARSITGGKTEEFKEIMIIMAHTAEAVSQRDQRLDDVGRWGGRLHQLKGGGSGTRGQTGLPANFRQKAPEIHGSLVSPR